MADTNLVSISGEIANEPHFKSGQSQNGDWERAFFVIHTQYEVNGNAKRRSYVPMILWNPDAKDKSLISKGTKVEVTGYVKTSSQEDDDGNKTSRMEIVAETIAPYAEQEVTSADDLTKGL